MKKIYLYILTAGLVFNFCMSGYAQYQDLSTDSIFMIARQYAFNGQKPKARMLCDTILNRNQNYADARVLKGRTYSWEGKYDSAREQFNKVLELKPGYYDAIDALTDVDYWADDYNACIKHCDDGLELFPGDRKLTINKAKSLESIKQNLEAIKLLEDYLAKDTLKNKDTLLNKDSLIIEDSLNSVVRKLLKGMKNDYLLSQQNRISIDSVFMQARQFAFNGEKQKARMLCDTILKINENYIDARVLKGRTYSWEKKYDSARKEFKRGLALKPGYYDAINALTDVDYWADDYDTCIMHCDEGLELFPYDGKLTINKAKSLESLQKIDEAIKLLEDFLVKDSSNNDVRKLLEALKIANLKNKISISYSFSYFDDGNSPWHLAYLQYLRKTKIGSVIGRINYANRFSTTNGWQIEADAYPKLSRKFYMYLNTGFSPTKLFPDFRFGADLYHNLPRAFDASAGFRYLKFSSSSDVIIYSLYLGKYIGNFWVGGRTFITPNALSSLFTSGTSISGQILFRKYFEDADNYIGLRISYGVSPDERTKNISTNEYIRLNSRAARIEYNKKIKKRWIINTGFIFENEERLENVFRNIYTIDFGLGYIF